MTHMEWLLWIDIETTGLDPMNCNILQVACMLSSVDLEIQKSLTEYTIKCDKTILDNMNEWCKNTHNNSGLLKNVNNSMLSLIEVENSILNILNCNVSLKNKIYLAGNSVHFDKKFIEHHMKRLYSRLSHRIVDVSSLGIVLSNLDNNICNKRPIKKYKHTAESDLSESIEEYKFYLSYIKSNISS
jgi:oligoribonuclease